MAGRLGSIAPKLARLSVFLLVVGVGLHLVLGRVMRSQVDSTLMDLGAGIVQLDAAGPRRGPRVVELNGARLHFAVSESPRDVGAVLDRAEHQCAPAGDRQLRGEGGGRGYVACFVPAPAPVPVVGETRASPPGYRYTYAQPGHDHTVVISLETDGSVDLRQLFPPEGDAPGFDAPGLPRPHGVRRLLSAQEQGRPQQMTLYTDPRRTPAELEAWYRGRLPALGWRPLDGGRRPAGSHVLVASRGETLAALVFATEDAGGASIAILTSL